MENYLSLLKQGDERAFETLINENKNNVYRVALSVVHNPQDAEDIAQEAFVKVFLSIKSFDGRSSLSTWLYRITYNLSLDFLKKHGKKALLTKTLDDPENTELLSLADDSYIPEEVFEKKQLKQDLFEALESLPEEQRVLIEMKDVNGFSYEEILAITGLKEGTLKSRLNRGRLSMKKILNKKWNITE